MKPRFIDEMRNITVEVGRDITFTCTVSDIHVSTFNRHIIVQIIFFEFIIVSFKYYLLLY